MPEPRVHGCMVAMQGCPGFQAAQIVPHTETAGPLPAEAPLTDSPVRHPRLGGSHPHPASSGDTFQQGSPPHLVTPTLQPLASGADAPPRLSSHAASDGCRGDTALGPGERHADEAPDGPPSADAAPASRGASPSSVALTEVLGDTLLEPPGSGGIPDAQSGGEAQATSPCESPGVAAGGAAAADGHASEGSDEGPGAGLASAGGRGGRGGSQAATSLGGQATGRFSDGEPDYFADLLGSGPFCGFGQQVEPPGSQSEASEGQPRGARVSPWDTALPLACRLPACLTIRIIA